MTNFKVNDHSWNSEEEYNKYSEFLKKKLRMLFDMGYYPYWSEESNWIHIRKKLPNKKDETRMVLLMEAKVFSEPSTFGINDGRISKMSIRERGDYPNHNINVKIWFSYDRGNDINSLDENPVAKKLYEDMIEVFDKEE